MPGRIPEQATPFARALARGDRGALGEYAKQVRRPLFSYALRLVGQREEAEDLAQEALTRLHEQAAAGKLRPDEKSIRALLFSTIHNLAIDALRRNGRALRHQPAAEMPTAPAPGANLLRAQIERALADLPARHREALLLREYGGLAYADIAATLGVTDGAAKIYIYRARRKLATLLDRDGQYIGGTAPATEDQS